MKKSIITNDTEHCYLCGSPMVEEHHIYGGHANRRISDSLRLTVPLCQLHHRGKSGVHFNKELMVHLHQVGQKAFEEQIGTREQFIATFGRNYLEGDKE